MLNADRALRMAACPRCGVGGYERLKSHGHCVNCNYTDSAESEEMLAIPVWAVGFLREAKDKRQRVNDKGARVPAHAVRPMQNKNAKTIPVPSHNQPKIKLKPA